jgi:hypothetical protein
VVLGTLLCLTVAATVWVNGDDVSQGIQQRPRKAAALTGNAASTAMTDAQGQTIVDSGVLRLDRLTGRLSPSSDQDAFVSRSWVIPPPPPAPVVPSAPALPFTYIGKLEEGPEGPVTVYLMQGELAYHVRVGDIIDKTYRVESINAMQIVLMYLPMSTPQTLVFGNT